MEKYQVEFSAMAPFAMVYGPVVVDTRLNDAAVRLYTLLWILGDRFKEGWHSQKLLARLLHVTDRTIRTSLKTLAETGLITTKIRRPKPTLIRIEDPHTIYGAAMNEFYGFVREESKTLRRDESQPSGANRKNSSNSIGKNLPIKKIKEVNPMKGAGKSPRTSPEESFNRVLVRSESLPAKKRLLKAPLPKAPNPSRWGGEKFYLYALSLADKYRVRVRDERNHASRVPPRYSREMNWAMRVFQEKGLGPKAFTGLLELIFKNWDAFHRHFPKEAFSVYDLRYAAGGILKTARNLEGEVTLDDLEDIEEEKKPAPRRAPELEM